MQQTDHMK